MSRKQSPERREKRSNRVLRIRCARHEATKSCRTAILLPLHGCARPTSSCRRLATRHLLLLYLHQLFSQSPPSPRIWSAVSLSKLIPWMLLFPSRARSMTYKHYFLHLALSAPCFTRLDSSVCESFTIFKATPVIARMHRPRKSFNIRNANSDPSIPLVAARNLLNLRFASS